MPSASSRASEPVGMTSTRSALALAEAHDRALSVALVNGTHHLADGFLS